MNPNHTTANAESCGARRMPAKLGRFNHFEVTMVLFRSLISCSERRIGHDAGVILIGVSYEQSNLITFINCNNDRHLHRWLRYL